MSKNTTLELAMNKAAALPEDAQERIGREILVRLERLSELATDLAVGLRELDSGSGRPLDPETIIRLARDKHVGS